MAGFYIETKLRPCLVYGEKHLFHGLYEERQIVAPSILQGGHGGGVISTVIGVVEDESGCMKKVYPENIRFLDNGIFKDYSFSEEKGETNGQQQTQNSAL